MKKMSKATGGTGQCPKCGAAQFTAKRSGGAKAIGVVTFGIGAVLAPKSRVRCVGFKTEYRRG